MPLARLPGLVLMTAFAVALAGCSDGGGGTDPTGSTTPSPTDGTGSPTTTTGPTPPTPMGPVYINGTASGVLDCTLIANDGPTTGGSTQSLTPEMANGTYALSVTEDATGLATLCMVFDDGTTGNSGTIPPAATGFTVYADTAPEGAGYSVRIDLAP